MIPLNDDNPTERTPVVTIATIVACVLVFSPGKPLSRRRRHLIFQYGAIPALVFGEADPPEMSVAVPVYATLITSMFLHGGWMHLTGNMLYLRVFGNNAEHHGACEVHRVLPHMRNSCRLEPCLTDSSSSIPMIGASGAISGILGAYVLLFPRARVLVMMPGLGATRVAAGFVLGIWFVMQLLTGGMRIGDTSGGVAFFAHIGGFLAGMALIGLFKRPDVHFLTPARRGRLERLARSVWFIWVFLVYLVSLVQQMNETRDR